MCSTKLRRFSKNWKVPAQSLLGGRLGLGTQPHYKAPDDPRVENRKTQSLASSEAVPLIMVQGC